MFITYLLIQSTPEVTGHTEQLFLSVVLFLFLVMVVGFFGWILKELTSLRDRLSNNQDKVLERLDLNNTEATKKLEEFRVQMHEHDNFREVITLKLEHISEHLPDYALVFRKFTEIDDQISAQGKQLRRYEYEIDRLTTRIKDLHDKKKDNSS